eukprot:7391647-Prymnesium_polylepis.2
MVDTLAKITFDVAGDVAEDFGHLVPGLPERGALPPAVERTLAGGVLDVKLDLRRSLDSRYAVRMWVLVHGVLQFLTELDQLPSFGLGHVARKVKRGIAHWLSLRRRRQAVGCTRRASSSEGWAARAARLGGRAAGRRTGGAAGCGGCCSAALDSAGMGGERRSSCDVGGGERGQLCRAIRGSRALAGGDMQPGAGRTDGALVPTAICCASAA